MGNNEVDKYENKNPLEFQLGNWGVIWIRLVIPLITIINCGKILKQTNLKELSEDTMESDQKQAETERENFMLERGEHHWARSTFIWVSLEVKRWGSS